MITPDTILKSEREMVLFARPQREQGKVQGLFERHRSGCAGCHEMYKELSAFYGVAPGEKLLVAHEEADLFSSLTLRSENIRPGGILLGHPITSMLSITVVVAFTNPGELPKG
ncbi:MAG: hypothetical protein HYZ01_01680 [Ignavibacteriales bacterium]|nr:hypothetical protein [Ignavibacteriales bacterium]